MVVGLSSPFAKNDRREAVGRATKARRTPGRPTRLRTDEEEHGGSRQASRRTFRFEIIFAPGANAIKLFCP